MSAHRSASALILAFGVLASAVAAAESTRETKQGGFELVAGRAGAGASDEIAGGAYAATISVAQPDAQPAPATGGAFIVTGGVIAPVRRADAVFANGFE